jgi:hypothetical protein
MPLRAIARLIQTMLYAQRFFPYYVYNILGGIEEDGKLMPLLGPLLFGRLTLACTQVPGPFTLLIPWDPTNARLVGQRELPSLWCNLSSTIRRVSEYFPLHIAALPLRPQPTPSDLSPSIPRAPR